MKTIRARNSIRRGGLHLFPRFLIAIASLTIVVRDVLEGCELHHRSLLARLTTAARRI
jgi:hypothetical protein